MSFRSVAAELPDLRYSSVIASALGILTPCDELLGDFQTFLLAKDDDKTSQPVRVNYPSRQSLR